MGRGVMGASRRRAIRMPAHVEASTCTRWWRERLGALAIKSRRSFSIVSARFKTTRWSYWPGSLGKERKQGGLGQHPSLTHRD